MACPWRGSSSSSDAQVAFDRLASHEQGGVHCGILAALPLGVRETTLNRPRPCGSTCPLPQANTFQSSAIKAVGAGKYEVAGKLSIKGCRRGAHHAHAWIRRTPPAASGFRQGWLQDRRENEWADTSMVAE